MGRFFVSADSKGVGGKGGAIHGASAEGRVEISRPMIAWFVNHVNILMCGYHSNAVPGLTGNVWGAPGLASPAPTLCFLFERLDGGVHQVWVVELGHVAGAFAGYR